MNDSLISIGGKLIMAILKSTKRADVQIYSSYMVKKSIAINKYYSTNTIFVIPLK